MTVMYTLVAFHSFMNSIGVEPEKLSSAALNGNCILQRMYSNKHFRILFHFQMKLFTVVSMVSDHSHMFISILGLGD